MSDETIEIPAALRDRFEAEVKEAYKEHEKEFRRSLGIRTSFYEKLFALDAGSIAVAASIGIALIAKPQLQSSPLHAAAHWLVMITFSLWLSLFCAVVHNFLAVEIAKLESAYSHDDFVREIIRRGLAMPWVADPPEILDQLKGSAQEDHILHQQQNMKRRQFLHPCATVLAYISMGSFLTAYTFVMVCVVRLWWITP